MYSFISFYFLCVNSFYFYFVIHRNKNDQSRYTWCYTFAALFCLPCSHDKYRFWFLQVEAQFIVNVWYQIVNHPLLAFNCKIYNTRFPDGSDENWRNKWLTKLGLLEGRSEKIERRIICSRHFEPSCYTNGKLLHGSIPTLLLDIISNDEVYYNSSSFNYFWIHFLFKFKIFLYFSNPLPLIPIRMTMTSHRS